MNRSVSTSPRSSHAPVGPFARVAIAFASGVLGWLVGGASAIAFDRLLVEGGGSGSAEMLIFLLFIGLVAGGAWVVAVLPLVLLVDHGSWLFRPSTAPMVGAVCGVLLLVLVNWIFFDLAPWEMFTGSMDVSEAYLLTLAGIIGGGTWSVYTLWMRRIERRV